MKWSRIIKRIKNRPSKLLNKGFYQVISKHNPSKKEEDFYRENREIIDRNKSIKINKQIGKLIIFELMANSLKNNTFLPYKKKAMYKLGRKWRINSKQVDELFVFAQNMALLEQEVEILINE